MPRRAASGRHGRHLESMASYPSIDAYLLKKQFCQISSRSDLKRRGLRLSLKSVATTRRRRTKKKNKIVSDQKIEPERKQ